MKKSFCVCMAILFLTTAMSFGTNLIVNGDFSNGNTGFSSDYTFHEDISGNQELSLEGSYSITTNPYNVHYLAASYNDHTTHSGKMMVVNGAYTAGRKIWEQAVLVSPNTQYDFAFWISSWTKDSPVVLQVYINSNPLGSVFEAPTTTGQWSDLSRVWHSGASTNAVICLEIINPYTRSDDFAIDDISLSVPEPATLLLLGLSGLALRKRVK